MSSTRSVRGREWRAQAHDRQLIGHAGIVIVTGMHPPPEFARAGAAVVALAAIAGCIEPSREKGPPSGVPLATVRGAATGDAGAEPEATVEPRRSFLVLGGDVMLMDQIREVAEERGQGDLAAGYAWFFHALAPVIADLEGRGEVLFVVNLESPVATERVEPVSYPPTFNGPRAALLGLKAAGVDVVTVANNHSNDQGRAGLAETIEAARAAGLGVAGGGTGPGARAPLVVGDGVEVAILSYFMRPGGRAEPEDGPHVAILDDRSPGEVAAAREAADAVVVTIHWVGEFADGPPDALVDMVHALVLAGADAVVCHGPHVALGVEVEETPDGRQALVAWSVGNLLSNMGWEVYPGTKLEPGKDSAQRIESRVEALVVLEITADGGRRLTAAGVVPLWLMDNRYAVFRPGGGPRLIYPLPLPGCVLPDPFPCFPASKPGECDALRDMVASSCRPW